MNIHITFSINLTLVADSGRAEEVNVRLLGGEGGSLCSQAIIIIVPALVYDYFKKRKKY